MALILESGLFSDVRFYFSGSLTHCYLLANKYRALHSGNECHLIRSSASHREIQGEFAKTYPVGKFSMVAFRALVKQTTAEPTRF